MGGAGRGGQCSAGCDLWWRVVLVVGAARRAVADGGMSGPKRGGREGKGEGGPRERRGGRRGGRGGKGEETGTQQGRGGQEMGCIGCPSKYMERSNSSGN